MTPMWEMLAGLSAQNRWAADAQMLPVAAAQSVLVCGMGGSAISGDVAAAVAPSTLITVNKGYSLPGWASDLKPLVVAVSYSGNTEETRSAVSEALDLGLSVAVVTGGHGFDVRNFHKLFRALDGVDAYIQHLDDFASSPTEVRDSYDAVLFYIMMMQGPADEGLPWYAGKPKTALNNPSPCSRNLSRWPMN